MKKCAITLASIIFLLSFRAQAQDIKIGLYTGIGTFHMNEMKIIQEEVFADQVIPGAEITNSFPAFLNFGINVSAIQFPYEYGGLIRYESTGGRIGYSDVTGSFFFDQIAEQFLLGFSARAYLVGSVKKPDAPLLPFLEFRAGGSLANVAFEQTLRINGESESTRERFYEESFFLEPVIGIKLTKSKFALEPIVSAFLDINMFKSGLHLKEEPDAVLRNGQGVINLNWTGLRAGINFTIAL